jgi:hypothetical protein
VVELPLGPFDSLLAPSTIFCRFFSEGQSVGEPADPTQRMTRSVEASIWEFPLSQNSQCTPHRLGSFSTCFAGDLKSPYFSLLFCHRNICSLCCETLEAGAYSDRGRSEFVGHS